MAYATKDDLRAFLKLQVGETADDTLLQNAVTDAQNFIEGAECCNRLFEASTDTTRYFDALQNVDDLTLVFDIYCCGITTVVNGDGSTLPSSVYITLPPNITPYYGIKLLASGGYVWQYLSDPENAIAVTGKWAYSLAAPAKIKRATLVLAKYLYRQLNADSDADRPLMTGDGVVIMPSNLPKLFWDLVGGYRRRE
ncbi:MAG: hypothetical protein WCF84_26720 [Anaerolineae bacterium]